MFLVGHSLVFSLIFILFNITGFRILHAHVLVYSILIEFDVL